jgi:hypothetical protein
MGVPSAFSSEIGSQEHLLAHHGLTEDAIVATARELLETKAAHA